MTRVVWAQGLNAAGGILDDGPDQLVDAASGECRSTSSTRSAELLDAGAPAAERRLVVVSSIWQETREAGQAGVRDEQGRAGGTRAVPGRRSRPLGDLGQRGPAGARRQSDDAIVSVPLRACERLGADDAHGRARDRGRRRAGVRMAEQSGQLRASTASSSRSTAAGRRCGMSEVEVSVIRRSYTRPDRDRARCVERSRRRERSPSSTTTVLRIGSLDARRPPSSTWRAGRRPRPSRDASASSSR